MGRKGEDDEEGALDRCGSHLGDHGDRTDGGADPSGRQSRVDLTTLAGQNVHFRFRTGTDISIGALGWLVDDLSVFSCAPGAIDAVPSITLDSPADAAAVRGVVQLTATASDDVGVDQVEFFVDGNPVGLGAAGANDTWSLQWNSAGIGDEQQHTFMAEVTDTSAQTAADSTSVNVLSNAVADFDGDGATDIAVFRPSTGRWYINGTPGYTAWGNNGDSPTPKRPGL